MLALSRTSGYAISALSRLAGPGGPWTLAKDIAKSADIPKPYLSTVLNALVQDGLIKAKRGYRGGFVLARPAERISVLQVVEAVEGEAWRDACLLGLSQCTDERACPSHEFWKEKRDQIEDFLRGLTLAQVAEFEKGFLAQEPQPVRARNAKVHRRRGVASRR